MKIKTNCKLTYDWLVKIQEKRRQINKDIEELTEMYSQAKIEIAQKHGYPLEGDIVEYKGKELKVDKIGREIFKLYMEREYSILVLRRKNGEWSKRSSGVSIVYIEGVPSTHEYGCAWLLSDDDEIVLEGR